MKNKSLPVPARGFARGAPDFGHVTRLRSLCELRRVLSPPKRGARRPEARSGSKRSGEGWLASLSLFAFPVSPKAKRIWNAGRRRDRNLRTFCGAAPPPEREGTARLPAFHRGSCQGVCSPLVRSGPGFVGEPSKGRGSLRRRPDHFQRRTSHAGRNAGRHDARTARERVASPPAGSAPRPTAAICLRGGVLYEREDSCGYVTEMGTDVKGQSPRQRHWRLNTDKSGVFSIADAMPRRLEHRYEDQGRGA